MKVKYTCLIKIFRTKKFSLLETSEIYIYLLEMNTPHYSNSHNLGIILPKIVAFSVQTLVYVPSLSSRLLLRNIPNFFDYYGSSPMCLSSRNRSNSKAFRHILPRVAPVCEGMHYHKTGVPWQMKSIFIIVLFLLVLP